MCVNKAAVKTAMPEQPPDIRNRNFEEVALGYTSEQAQFESERCIQCKNKPCVAGCPVGVDIPRFIGHIQSGDIAAAAAVIKETNTLPAICGRVCPQETQCEQLCVRGRKGEPVGIGRLERYAADWALNHPLPVEKTEGNGIKVAVVGSGPAGLTAAGELTRFGYEVTIFEALHKPGGVLVYGIPEFRLPKAIVKREIDQLTALGVKMVKNCVVGRSLTIDEMFENGYRAVFIGSGAGLPHFLNIPGENLNNVYSANEFLTRINLMRADLPDSGTPIHRPNRAIVVGGGNVAMDAARCAMRLGAEQVTIVYRRSFEEMPARLEEIHHAKEEGIRFELLTNPVELTGDDRGCVSGMLCDRMELGEPDDSGRRRPVVIPDSRFALEADCVIMAIGNSPNPLIRTTTPGLDANRWGCLIADEATGKTSKKGVYAGGDTVTGAATVILAMGAGRAAALAIHEEIQADRL